MGGLLRVCLGLTLVGSLLCLLAYAWDKAAARRGAWRTPERALLWLGLLGGWPGGWLAQRLLRHKTAKRSFLRAFWTTVALNVTLWALLFLWQTRGWRWG